MLHKNNTFPKCHGKLTKNASYRKRIALPLLQSGDFGVNHQGHSWLRDRAVNAVALCCAVMKTLLIASTDDLTVSDWTVKTRT